MGLPSANEVINVLLIATLFGASIATRDWDLNEKQNKNYPNVPREIIVGGITNWTFGFDYISWAFQSSPFYVNDTLVFRYSPPSENNIHPHSVYLLPNYSSFIRCDLNGSQMIANVTDGGDDGFKFILSKSEPYYFACGASNGFHCNNGTMKFSMWPLHSRWH